MTMGRTSWAQSVFTVLVALVAICFQAVVIGEVTSTITRINAYKERTAESKESLSKMLDVRQVRTEV